MPETDEHFDEVTEGEEKAIGEKLKRKWATVEALVGHPGADRPGRDNDRRTFRGAHRTGRHVTSTGKLIWSLGGERGRGYNMNTENVRQVATIRPGTSVPTGRQH